MGHPGSRLAHHRRRPTGHRPPALPGAFLVESSLPKSPSRCSTGALSRAITTAIPCSPIAYTHYVRPRHASRPRASTSPPTRTPTSTDRLERARVQATDRLAMIQQMAGFSSRPDHAIWSIQLVWVLALDPVACSSSALRLPSSPKPTSLSSATRRIFRQTPVKRIMDYLRMVGGSKEAARTYQGNINCQSLHSE